MVIKAIWLVRSLGYWAQKSNLIKEKKNKSCLRKFYTTTTKQRKVTKYKQRSPRPEPSLTAAHEEKPRFLARSKTTSFFSFYFSGNSFQSGYAIVRKRIKTFPMLAMFEYSVKVELLLLYMFTAT